MTIQNFTIYVGKSGNDTTGDGSLGNPYLTIGKATTVAKTLTLTVTQPCAIKVGAGKYVENLSLPPFVTVSPVGTSVDVLIGDGTTNAIALDATAWSSVTDGWSAVENILTNWFDGSGNGSVLIDFTGTTSPGQVDLGGVGIAGSLTVKGDSTHGGYCFCYWATGVDTTTTVTGANLGLGDGCELLGNVTLQSTSSQPTAVGIAANSMLGAVLTLDASAGKNVSWSSQGTGVVGPLTLKNGSGGSTSYMADAVGIPGTVTLQGGAADIVRLTYARAIGYTSNPSSNWGQSSAHDRQGGTRSHGVRGRSITRIGNPVTA
jgi:hypothetical protein